jgi:hypothetical protein
MGKKGIKYKIEKILDRKISSNFHFVYLIKYKGLNYPIWEPIENLQNQEFLKQVKRFDSKFPKFINLGLMNTEDSEKIRKIKQINKKFYSSQKNDIIVLSDEEKDTDTSIKSPLYIKEDNNEVELKSDIEKYKEQIQSLNNKLKEKDRIILDLKNQLQEKILENEQVKENYKALNNDYGKIVEKFKIIRQKLKENKQE